MIQELIMEEEKKPLNFIEQIIENDLEDGLDKTIEFVVANKESLLFNRS